MIFEENGYLVYIQFYVILLVSVNKVSRLIRNLRKFMREASFYYKFPNYH